MAVALLTVFAALEHTKLRRSLVLRQTPNGLPRHLGDIVGAAAWGLDTGSMLSTYRISFATWGTIVLCVAGFGGPQLGVAYGLGFCRSPRGERLCDSRRCTRAGSQRPRWQDQPEQGLPEARICGTNAVHCRHGRLGRLGGDMETLRSPDEGVVERRGLIRRVTALSLGLFGGLAALGTDEAAAYRFGCCYLALDKKCSGCTSGGFTCPSGFSKRYWYCCQNGQLYGCGECTKSTSCYGGPWACSCGFRASGPCQG